MITFRSLYSGGISVPWYGFVIEDRFKYIQAFLEDEIPDLYHIDNDPEELHNLALLPQYRQTVTEHPELLKSELARTRARFMADLPSISGP